MRTHPPLFIHTMLTSKGKFNGVLSFVCSDVVDWNSTLLVNLIVVAIVLVMAMVLFATMTYQCAATWRWIKDRTCRDYNGDGDPSSTMHAAIRISHSLPDMQSEQLQEEYVQEHKDNKKVTHSHQSQYGGCYGNSKQTNQNALWDFQSIVH